MIYPSIIDNPEEDKGDGLLKFDVNNTEVSDEVMGNGWTLVADYYKKAIFRPKMTGNSMQDFFGKRPIKAYH